MAHDVQASAATAPTPRGAEEGHADNRLGAFLCWAVVFADIGTSVYYVPGILYGQVGLLAGLFVTLTLVVFLLLTLKYAEVTVRFPEGGGVVTVAARGINPWAGAVGGMFILVDYFLTSAISSDSGLIYLSAVFHRIEPLVLPLTLIVVAALGVLNWWGIKESATVSAGIAVAAFITDIIIIIAVFLNVPAHAIQQVFGEMFSGSLTPVTLLTGFAGSFLAFSGLESISQLSPVMRLPRRKTVTVALALVVVTVGITSPLLTIFSTTLLTSCTPNFAQCSTAIWEANKASLGINPDQFISLLAATAGGSTFGRLLEILTAVTASTLLIFASNTAIIGAYHVFLALSRMRFFPAIVEKRNAWRGTPHISILLATAIPMLVLVAVRGNITILGDMYAFGLLGAFSLTCIALDLLRTRERSSGVLPDLAELEAEGAQPANGAGAGPMARLSAQMGAQFSPAMRQRLLRMRQQYTRQRAMLAQGSAPAMAWWVRVWPNIKYYLGFATTALVVIAWVTNLIAKPLATGFGGSVTLLGVAVAVINYRRQLSRGETLVFPMAMLRPIPDSLLVVLPAGAPSNDAVIRAAVRGAAGHSLVFLYEGKPEQRPPQFMQFNDPYFYDEAAQRAFSQAARISRREGVQNTYYVYRVGDSGSVLSVWRAIRPDEIIAEKSVAKALSKQVSPEYVRFENEDGVHVAHYVRHHVAGLGRPEGATTGGPARAGRNGAAPAAANGVVPPPASKGEQPKESEQGITTTKPAPPSRPPAESRPGPAGKPGQGRIEPVTPRAGGEPAEPETPASTNIEDYVWTGTQLVRRDELERQEREDDSKGESE